jgi:hypothetical protein
MKGRKNARLSLARIQVCVADALQVTATLMFRRDASVTKSWLSGGE